MTTIDDPRRRRTVLIAVCVALMAVIASVTGLNVAQPELAVEFGASQSEVLWIINAYTMTLAALLLPLGALGDRRGRKPMLLLGLSLFGAANVVAGLATSAEIMLGSRIVAGAGAAMIMPVTLAVITSTFPERERAKGIGVWTAVAGGGGILGMYLSALLVDVASWRWLFVLPVVLVVASLLMVVRSVPDSREQTAHRFDTVGSAASIIAVLSLIFVLHEGPVNGWTEPSTVIALGGGLLAAVGFVAWERRRPAPLLDVRLFRDRGLAGGSLVLLAVFGVQAGIFVVLFPFLQAVLGWSALRATLAMMPMALLMMLASGLAPRVSARLGSRPTMALGILAGGAGLALMALLVSVDGGYRSVLPGMLAMGLGMGLSMTPSTEAITGSLPAERQGVASALNDVTREFGTALGVALLGAVLSAGYRTAVDARLAGIPADVAGTAREGVANAIAAPPRTTHRGPAVGGQGIVRRRLATRHVGRGRRHGPPPALRPRPGPATRRAGRRANEDRRGGPALTGVPFPGGPGRRIRPARSRRRTSRGGPAPRPCSPGPRS
ncbi:MFS transporter [Paractinoplanes deccanensis]|uniref:MFS transporter n=1 Tax=Paractinoplanes deccanensis TaxID=113561 RepID=A0ABQ3YJF1_9ACTN|nr:MFS transporter [Actinoplanes deccanensis]GID80128.1 MFS transporter [Actinoplanes deccanensis]